MPRAAKRPCRLGGVPSCELALWPSVPAEEAVIRRRATSATRQRAPEANGIDCGASCSRNGPGCGERPDDSVLLGARRPRLSGRIGGRPASMSPDFSRAPGYLSHSRQPRALRASPGEPRDPDSRMAWGGAAWGPKSGRSRAQSACNRPLQRRGRDSNPRWTERPTTVFETAPFNRSGTPPRTSDDRAAILIRVGRSENIGG
jgi:hypothetical protein